MGQFLGGSVGHGSLPMTHRLLCHKVSKSLSVYRSVCMGVHLGWEYFPKMRGKKNKFSPLPRQCSTMSFQN